MEIEEAIRYATLWRAGKMIGGDEDEVRNALLGEVERLRSEVQRRDPPIKVSVSKREGET